MTCECLKKFCWFLLATRRNKQRVMIHDGLCTFILCYVIKLLCYVDHFDLQKYISDLLHWRPKKHRTNTCKYHLQLVRNHRTEVITAGWPGSHPTLQVLTETYIDQNYDDYEPLHPTWNILNNEESAKWLFFWWFPYQSMVALENNRAHNAFDLSALISVSWWTSHLFM